eukprot:6212750-Pleurochrysis_carterae.AAC.6
MSLIAARDMPDALELAGTQVFCSMTSSGPRQLNGSKDYSQLFERLAGARTRTSCHRLVKDACHRLSLGF